MPERKPVLVMEQVTKFFNDAGGRGRITVLQEVIFQVAAGESVAIIGPSGSGKSTLLNIAGSLDQPSSGRVWLDGKELAGAAEAELAAMRSEHLGFIFQGHHLLPQCSALENVLLPTLARKQASSAEAEARAGQLLDRVGLGARASHRPGQLSGGERQRVAVVRALINRPKLVLADEPTGALDRAAAEQLGELLVELNREEGVAMVVVTHSLELARRMQSVRELRGGQLHPI